MGITETTATGVAVIAAMVQAELTNKAKIVHTIRNYTNLVEAGAKSVSFPLGTSLTAADKVENVATTAEKVTYSVDQLVLSSYKHCYTILEDRARVQSKIDVEADIMARQVSAIVRAVETSCNTAILLASSSGPDHQIDTDGYTITLAKINEANSLLDIQNVPEDERFILVHPTQKKELLDITAVISANQFGSADPIRNGQIGSLFGMPIIMSPAATENKVCVYHADHVAFAAQLAMGFEKGRSLADLADEFSSNMLCGVKVLDSGKRGVVITVL